jgi:hypothetical protein
VGQTVIVGQIGNLPWQIANLPYKRRLPSPQRGLAANRRFVSF